MFYLSYAQTLKMESKFMSVYPGAGTVALRRVMDAMSLFYEKRSAAHRRKHFMVIQCPRPGLCFVFHGMILSACEHFAIDFLTKQGSEICDDCDVLLQIGSRLPQNYITRNSRLMGKWGPEENSSYLTFQLNRGKSFWMQILLTEECFFISVNGFHFAKYIHRMPYRWLEAVDVLGDVSDIVIDTYYVSEYPIRLTHSLPRPIPYLYDTAVTKFLQDGQNLQSEWIVLSSLAKMSSKKYLYKTSLPLPFYGKLLEDQILVDGCALRIEGRVRLMPQRFSIAFQKGQEIWPQPTVSFYFSPCFLRSRHDKIGKAIITRRAYLNGEWVNCTVSRLNTSLRPGGAFVIVIVCRDSYYEIFVNNKSLFHFKYQMKPDCVDIVNIRGDIKLWEVVIESSKMVKKQQRGRTAVERAMSAWKRTGDP
ncbi:galectin-9B isoform X1 [Drosophila elegans]|uniref:galectin-9B isoform X1 n=2 Tax=Drosophila elegans TaxID=30023 RepID=UPI0007E75FF6|nr:galectin-9B isoform X1 [Drosophila elegans]